jgi:uncharacterized protein (DUF1800 family)
MRADTRRWTGCQARLLWALPALALAALSGCGGGGGSAGESTLHSSQGNPSDSSQVAEARIERAQAHRFLQQTSFGPTPETVAAVQAQGYARWIDEQLTMAPTLASHQTLVEASAQTLGQPKARLDDVNHAWWTHALGESAQLRHRLAYALSQIFVVSMVNPELAERGRMTASYMDMLVQRSTGTYRDLIEGVALHPAMGIYLSHLRNRKEDPTNGRTPDENFARELMQLFSIGLHELNDDGTPVLRNGQHVPTYGASDVAGLARVFTGWSWHRPAGSTAQWWECFWGIPPCMDPTTQDVMPMSAYPQEHSTSEKRFLGVVVAPQSVANPQASLRVALDRLASHPNTAPFISRQLIMRLVTSNPSPAYVRRITQVFRSSGGQMGAVAKAILLDPEARNPAALPEPDTFGKIKEPVLRLSQLLRALEHRSAQLAAGGATPFYRAIETDSPASGLGQTPLRAPSVFNFYRPGYVPPQTRMANRQLVSPEMQMSTETSVVGYANYMAGILDRGWGASAVFLGPADVQFDYTALMNLDTGNSREGAQRLLDEVALRLLGQAPANTLGAQIVSTVAAMPRASTAQRRLRVITTVLAVLASPAYIVQQ